jgi:glycosyltransferase involved in cell wall biosynthesis
MKRVTLVFLGSTGAGPVYSLEMAKALAESNRCILQVIISSSITNVEKWKEYFDNNLNVNFHIIDAYTRSIFSVIKTKFFFKGRKQYLVDLILNYQSDVLYVPFGLLWASYVYKRINNKVQIITTLHDPQPHESIFKSFKLFIFNTFFGNESVDKANNIIILNKKDVEYVQNKYHKPVSVIPHANFNYYVRALNMNPKLKSAIGFFGRIEPYKGLDILIEAFEKLYRNDIKLIVAGAGTIDSISARKIANNKNIILINRYIEDEEFQGLMDQIDFIVLPYKRASQSGLIPMSFAFGKTVIATKVGALDEQVPFGTGLLVEPNVESISKAICDLYENPQKINLFGVAAKKYVDKELTWAHSAKLVLNIFEKAL